MRQAFKRLQRAELRDTLVLIQVFVGFVLPLDFVYQIDGFRMYLSPAEIAQVLAFATFVYAALGVAITIPFIIGISPLVLIMGWSHKTLLKTVIGGVSTAVCVLVFFKHAKFWLLSLKIAPPITMSDHTQWLIPISIGTCMFAVYRKPVILARISQWTAISSLILIVFAGFVCLSRSLHLLPGTATPSGVAGSVTPASESTSKPNIVFITIDTFSARHSSAYGYERQTTPALEQLTENATRFENFYSNGNFTMSGIPSLLYGQRPWTHRVFTPGYVLGNPISAQTSLFAQLKRNGYTTLAVTSNPFASPALNRTSSYVDESVDCALRAYLGMCLFLNTLPAEAAPLASLESVGRLLKKVDALMVPLGVWSSTDHHDPELVFSQARRMVTERRSPSPFVLWVHLFPPHAPYASPAPFLGRFDSSTLRNSRLNSTPEQAFAAASDPSFPESFIGRYDEALLYLDSHLGRFFDWLRQNQLYESSLIVVSADHGESFSRGFGAHGGVLLHNDVIRIPLIIKHPFQQQARSVASNAEQIDVVPTILDLAGIAAEGPLEGRSLKPILQGAATEQFDRPVFSMTFELNSRFKPLRTGTIAMIDGHWKYVTYRGYTPSAHWPELPDELYDLSVDPDEKNNVITIHPDVADRMKADVDKQLQSHDRLRE